MKFKINVNQVMCGVFLSTWAIFFFLRERGTDKLSATLKPVQLAGKSAICSSYMDQLKENIGAVSLTFMLQMMNLPVLCLT